MVDNDTLNWAEIGRNPIKNMLLVSIYEKVTMQWAYNAFRVGGRHAA